MKKLLPLAFIVAAIFACNTHADKESAGAPSANANDVLTVNNMYDISAVHAAMGKGDAAASQKIFGQAMNSYLKSGAPTSIDLFRSAIYKAPAANAYFQLGVALSDEKSYDEAAQALHIAEQLGYTPLAPLMYRLALVTSNQNIASQELHDSLMLHYMEVAIQMGYPHCEEFLKSDEFTSLRRVKNFQSTFDEAVAAGPGSSSPGMLFWTTFRNDFKQLRLPLTINTMWIQSHKLGDPISYDYEKFIPEMRNAEFSRDVSPQYYYCGIVTQDTGYTTLIYAGRNEELADANHYTPTAFILTSFDRQGKIIDKMLAAGQRYFTDTFKVLTIQPNLTFEIRDYKNIYKNDPEHVGYEKNYVVRSEPLGATYYRIAVNGKFERIDAPLAMR